MKNDFDDSFDRTYFSAGANSADNGLSSRGFATLDYQTSEFTWEQAVRVLRKNRRLGLVVAGLSILGTLAVVFALKDVYRPIATIEIAPPSSGIRTLQEVESSPEAEFQDYLETQTQILQSDALAVSVIRHLQLDSSAEFASRSLEATAPKAPSGIQEIVEGRDGTLLREQVALATLTPSESRALEKFRTDLSVNPIRNTRLVELSFASHDPVLARTVTNDIITKFIENDYRQRYSSTTQASAWLSLQLNDLYQTVLASNQAVSDYQRQHGLVELNDRDVPLSQLMAEASHQLSETQAARIENEAYLKMINSGQSEFVPAVRDDKVYQDLLIHRGDLRTQLAQARAVYGDANINVKKIDDQLTEIDRELDEQQKRIGDEIRTTYESAREREKLMLGNREQLQTQMVNANSDLVGYRVLKSEATANADLYNTLQARLKEAGIYAGLGSTNIRVVDLAENLQHPTSPHRAALIAIGVTMSFIVGILACFVKESLNNTVRTPEDVKAWAGLKSLALLPAMGPRMPTGKKPSPALGQALRSSTPVVADRMERSIAFMKPLTAEAEAMRDLRTSLTFSRDSDALKVVLISSAMEGEGKTTVAVNLAIALSQIGRTCLVDADLRQPMVARTFGVEATPGLTGVLNGSAPLSSALVGAPSFPGLLILPSGSRVDNPADVVESVLMQELCVALRKQFQFIVIDSSPVIRFSDARYLSQLADEVVLVGRYGFTTRRALQRSAELLQDVHAPLAGMVLNGIDYSSPDYHYFIYGYSRAAEKRNRSAEVERRAPIEDGDSHDHGKSRGAHA
jgi:polysaccharide biosynthesis transport protein